MEALWIDAYEHEYLGLADIKAMQRWILALNDAGYKFPLITSSRQSNRPMIGEGVLRGQVYKTGPIFQIGGEEGIPYSRHEPKSTSEWLEWVAGSAKYPRPPGKVFKVVLMTSNEWPLVKQWTLYHEKMFGFSNLYILDGSNDENCVEFLLFARDTLGVNVIFSQANLNEVQKELNEIMENVAASSDLIIKLDTDEFIAALTGHQVCPGSPGLDEVLNSFPENVFDCSVDPYRVSEYLNTADIYTGNKLNSLPNSILCNSSSRNYIHHFSFSIPRDRLLLSC